MLTKKNLTWLILTIVLVALLGVAYVLVANAAAANPVLDTPPGLLH
jgi:hypothetical protein